LTRGTIKSRCGQLVDQQGLIGRPCLRPLILPGARLLGYP
jgi:hypothetical protein